MVKVMQLAMTLAEFQGRAGDLQMSEVATRWLKAVKLLKSLKVWKWLNMNIWFQPLIQTHIGFESNKLF